MALARLRTALESIPKLTRLRHDSQAFAKWRRKTDIAVTNTSGNKTRHVHEFGSIRYSQSELVALTARTPDPYQEAYALTEGDVEIPSDDAGVVYIPLNEGGWKFELGKELKNAGYPVDFNNLAS